MIGPHNPQQAGEVGVQHDDRPDSAHEEEVKRAGEGDREPDKDSDDQ